MPLMHFPTPNLEGTITYDLDYHPLSQEGNPGEVDELAIFLPTLVRSASTCGDILELGGLVGIEGGDKGRGFRLTLEAAKHHFELWSGLYASLPTRSEKGPQAPSHFPLLGNRDHLTTFFADQPGMAWIGFRDSETNRWESTALDAAFNSETVQKATMMVLQADILLKGHGLPRRRLHLSFEAGALSSWAATNDDYLMVVQATPAPCLNPGFHQAGEAFLLGALL